jgi:hypothetical protein
VTRNDDDDDDNNNNNNNTPLLCYMLKRFFYNHPNFVVWRLAANHTGASTTEVSSN